MKYIIYFLVLIVVCGLSVAFGPVIKIYGQAPQILFLLAVVWALEKQDKDFLFIAFFAGLFLDFNSGSWPGTFTLPLLLTTLIIRIVIENFFVLGLSPKILLLLLLPAQILWYIFYIFFAWVFNKLHFLVILPGAAELITGFIIVFFYNLLLVYPIFLLAGYARFFVRKYVEKEYKVR